MLTSQQKYAVASLDGASVLVAAAGSGKTTVLVERYSRLLSQGRRPKEILTLSFTNEAARQLRERILKRLENDLGTKTLTEINQTRNIATLHSFCYSIIQRFGSEVGLPPPKKILNRFEFTSRFEHAYRDWIEKLEPPVLKQLLEEFGPSELRLVVQRLFDFRHTLSQTQSSDALLENISGAARPIYELLERQFLEGNLYSFDDLENCALKCLRGSSLARQTLQDEIRHVLVDEFQDTSHGQWELLDLLSNDNRQKLFLVGDPRQSIYRFRQADVQLFFQATRTLLEGGGTSAELTENFRSHPNLIVFINSVAGALFQDSPIPMSAMQPARPGIPSEGRVQKYHYKDPAEEPGLVATTIAQLMDRGVMPSNIAVLFRMSDRMPLFATALGNKNIFARFQTTHSLFEDYDCLDLVAYIHAIANPLDDYWMAAFLRSQYVRLDENKLLNLRRPRNVSYFELLGQFAHLQWFVDLIDGGETRLDACLRILFRETQHFPANGHGLLSLLEPLRTKEYSIFDAARDLNTWQNANIHIPDDHRATDQGGVRLLTVHGAKGLEFDHVFLVDLLRTSPRKTERILIQPGNRIAIRRRRIKGEKTIDPRWEEAARLDIEESKRVLYVALTRAREELHLFCPENDKLPENCWARWLAK